MPVCIIRPDRTIRKSILAMGRDFFDELGRVVRSSRGLFDATLWQEKRYYLPEPAK